MVINILAMVMAGFLALSPFINQFTLLNRALGLSGGAVIEGNYKWVLSGLGVGLFLLALYNLYIRRRSGMLFIIIGAICLATGYFHNDEKFQIVPLQNQILGGGEFLAFITSVLLMVLGIIQEFLLGSD